jgi:hypothetical protein
MPRRSPLFLPLALMALMGSAAPLAAQAPDPPVTVTEPPVTELPPPAAPRTMVGTWEFSNADREKTCSVTFRNESNRFGKRVEFDPACVGHFPFVKDIVAWQLNDNDFLKLFDGQGGSVLEFSEVESGIFEAPRPGEGILFIQASTAVGPPPKEADQMFGDWALARAGKSICGMTLANTPAGDDFYALKLKPGCDQLVTRFAPTAWQMDRGELVLKNARGTTWRFAEGENAAWTRVPEGPQPLTLARP